MSTLGRIENLTKDFADRRRHLVAAVEALEQAIEDLKRLELPRIRPLADAAANARNLLAAAIEEAPHLFLKPRTVTIEGIKVGLQKGRPVLTYDDAKVIARIRERMPERFDELVQVIERPRRSALLQLDPAELRRIGIGVIPAGDEVVIAATDSEIDKLVARWVQAAAEQATRSTR